MSDFLHWFYDDVMKLRLFSAAAILLASLTPVSAAQTYTVGGNRPVTVNLPDKLVNPAPLLILLHSASTSGAHQERYMKLGPVAKKNGLIYIAPDGLLNPEGKRFWNAAKSCCNRFNQEVDDVAYINSLVDEINAKTPVDQERIYLIGHSNGAFMSFTFACKTNRVAAIVSIAGAMDLDSDCVQKTPVSLLDIHGTADATIKFGGGVMNRTAYTSAEETVGRIASIDKCSNPVTIRMDFEPTIKGKETLASTYSCQTNTHLEFWKIAQGLHSPKLPNNFADQVISFLLRQSKQG